MKKESSLCRLNYLKTKEQRNYPLSTKGMFGPSTLFFLMVLFHLPYFTKWLQHVSTGMGKENKILLGKSWHLSDVINVVIMVVYFLG